MTQWLHWLAMHGTLRQLAKIGARQGDIQSRMMVDPAIRADPAPFYDELRELSATDGPLIRCRVGYLTVDHGLAQELLRSDDFRVIELDANLPGPLRWLEGRTRPQRFHPLRAPSLLAVEPPAHTRYRQAVSSAFTPRAVTVLRDGIRDTAEALLDDVERSGAGPAGAVDAMDRYCSQLPIAVISELLGVPDHQRGRLRELGESAALSLDLGLSWSQYRTVDRGLAAFDEWLTGHLAELRRNPGDDLLSRLIRAAGGGQVFTVDELRATAGLLLTAGFETTVNLLGNGVRLLLGNPHQLALLKDDPQIWPNAVEEILRLDSPAQLSVRLARRDVEIAGTHGFTLISPAGHIVVSGFVFTHNSGKTTIAAGTGAIVALLGLVQAGLGVREIYGFYQPSDVDPALTPALLTSFVNPNHQAGLFLLGIFSAGALAVHYRLQAQDTGDPNRLARARERALVALGAVAVQGVAVLLSLSRGAMAALLLVAPIGLMLAWARDGEARGRLWLRRVLVFAGFAGAAVLLARQSGAWAELATLARTGEPGFETKFRVAQDAVHLVPLSPVLGVGRGAFIDLFPAIDTQPAGVLHTHLESAPMAMLVEWGPVAGLAITLGLLWWWIAAMYSSSGRAGRARRIALCGPLALAIHSLGDFSLEFLGVAAPLCALAGALSERRMISRWSARGGLFLGGGVLVGALALSLWALPHTWQRRERSEVAERSDAARPAPAADLSPETALRMRPLDAGLHTRLAFQAIAREDWAEARARALVATRLQPNAADPWWLLTAAEDGLGNADASADALARTLAVVRKPLSPEVVDTLLRRYPSAEELATRMPDALAPWTVVMESIIPVAPSYAAILAATRTQVDRQEPEVLRLQVRIAFATQNPALARHHALLLRQLAPDAASSHLLLLQALRSFPVPRERELQAAAELALSNLALGSPGERGLIEEELVASLLRVGTPEARARARELLPALITRPGDRAALQRRNTLREAAAD